MAKSGVPYFSILDIFFNGFNGCLLILLVRFHFFNVHFFRFKDLEVQEKVLLTRHMVQDRWCDVKVPESQELKNAKANASCKYLQRIHQIDSPIS